MPAPSIAGFVVQRGGNASDPKVVQAFAAAMGWARSTLARPADDDLDDLRADNVVAVYGYMTDTLKLPRAAFGYYADDDQEGLQVAAGDIGRRWAGQLLYGNRTRSSFA